MKQALKPVALGPLEERFEDSVADALRRTIGSDADRADTVLAWGGAQAKDHLSELITRTLAGECQVVRRRSDEAVLVMAADHLEQFVGYVVPRERWADWLHHEPPDDRDAGLRTFIAAAAKDIAIAGGGEPASPKPWGVAQAKGHFKEVIDRVLEGQSQLLKRREEAVLLTCVSALVRLSAQAPKRRFSDFIAYDPALPTGAPLEITEAGLGTDEVEL